ncbi:uncharacterized protein LOC144146419 [Haemaphysalis longicornis]
MQGQIVLAVVITARMLAAQKAVPNDICEKPPAAADMVAVLKPLSKMTVDCLADVIMRYKIRSKFLINVLEGVCHYHAACVPNYLNNRTPQGRKATMECLAQRVSEKMASLLTQYPYVKTYLTR